MNKPYEVHVRLTASTVAEAEAAATGIRELHQRARIRIYRVRRRVMMTRRVLVDEQRPGGAQ